MTYGFIFYWLSWLLWIITTFFMKKEQLRLFLSTLILLTILGSDIYLSIGNYDLLVSFIALIIISGLLHANFLKPYYHLFGSFTIMIGYTSILLWKQNSFWGILISEFYLIPSICCIIIILMIKGLYSQLVTGIIGISTGEILYGFILSGYHLPAKIGDLDFFVNLYMIVLYLLLWHIIQNGKLPLYILRTKVQTSSQQSTNWRGPDEIKEIR